MKNLWNKFDADQYQDDLLALRVYSSRLVGQEPNLVLHGGGNTSVKAPFTDIFGEIHDAIYIKGSGWNLDTIEATGFAPVKLDSLIKLSRLKSLSDSDMVVAQRAAMLDQRAPNPSVEAILHAIIPFSFVDHTHADAVVTLSNTPNGEEILRSIYGDKVLIVPYVMPGFALAKKVSNLTRTTDWSKLHGIILMKHGIFSFSNDAKESYERMIDLVSDAELVLKERPNLGESHGEVSLLEIAKLRSAVSKSANIPMIAAFNGLPFNYEFASQKDVVSIACRGPLTPDHVIRTKRIPMITDMDISNSVERYRSDYIKYFERHASSELQQLDPAPRWAVWRDIGTVVFGRTQKEIKVVSDIVDHTIQAIQDAERLGGCVTLAERDIFDVEYWELEQAKLHAGKEDLMFSGQVVLVTGGFSGIGRACVKKFSENGANVVTIDKDPNIISLYKKSTVVAVVGDVTVEDDVTNVIHAAIQRFGGIDVLVNNIGIFPKSAHIEEIDNEQWQSSMNINLNSAMCVIKKTTPYLRHGWHPAIVIVGSKNVAAPGRGAATYSVAKAGLTQLGRIAALELASDSIRVNMVHPNSVFDTGFWTDDVISDRAAHYGISVAEYRSMNLLGIEITSNDVASVVLALSGPQFSRTTGAQISVDGGTDRTI